MTIISEDGNVFVDVGNYDYWNCFCSTIVTKLNNLKKEIPLALSFLERGECAPENCMETARQLNLVRDNLSGLPVTEIVYDMKKPLKKAPWKDKISPIVTSCGNFFTTADGKDLIHELNTVLCYCSVKKIAVICQ